MNKTFLAILACGQLLLAGMPNRAQADMLKEGAKLGAAALAGAAGTMAVDEIVGDKKEQKPAFATVKVDDNWTVLRGEETCVAIHKNWGNPPQNYTVYRKGEDAGAVVYSGGNNFLIAVSAQGDMIFLDHTGKKLETIKDVSSYFIDGSDKRMTVSADELRKIVLAHPGAYSLDRVGMVRGYCDVQPRKLPFGHDAAP